MPGLEVGYCGDEHDYKREPGRILFWGKQCASWLMVDAQVIKHVALDICTGKSGDKQTWENLNKWILSITITSSIFTDLFTWKAARERGRKRDRERSSTCMFTARMADTVGTGPGSSQTPLLGLLQGCRDRKAGAILFCFPRDIGRGLDQKQKSWDCI